MQPFKQFTMLTENETTLSDNTKTKSDELFENIIAEIKKMQLHSKDYWKARCTFLERYIDPTYTSEERENCGMLYRLLVAKENF